MKIGSTEIANIKIGSTAISKVYKNGVLYFRTGVLVPSNPDILFWLDGTILDVSGTKYFQDKSPNARNFLITGYDFSSDWTTGMPYKSAATISAPAGDAALIAADINNYLYDSGGTPNQIPVVSLFQDIDYEHRLFSRHAAQVLDGNNVETYEPRVMEVVFYNTVKSGADLTACNAYFGVPVEQSSTNAVWLAANGNDTTGDGTKALPYQTLDKVKATAKTYIYLKTGIYDIAAQCTFTGTTLLSVVGLGTCNFTNSGNSYGWTWSRPVEISGVHFIGTSVNYDSFFTKSIKYSNCKFTKSATGTTFIGSNTGSTDITIKDCVVNVTNQTVGFYYSNVAIANVSIVGCFGNIGTIAIPSIRSSSGVNTFKYNKGTSSIIAATYGANQYYFNNTITGGGLSTAITTGIQITYNHITAANNARALYSLGDYTANIEGVNVSRNTFIGNSAADIVFVGATGGDAATVAAVYSNNYVYNTSVSAKTEMSVRLLGHFTAENNLIQGGGLYIRLRNNTIVRDNIINAAYYTTAVQTQALAAWCLNGTNVTGVVFEHNIFIGGATGISIANMSSDTEASTGGINGAIFRKNTITNVIETGISAHTFLISGIDNIIEHNRFNMTNGYAIVVKSGGEHWTTTDAHIRYNIFNCTAASQFLIYNRGSYGVIVANNTVIGYRGTSIFKVDENTQGSDASMLCVNNLIKLGGNVQDYSIKHATSEFTSRNNSINLNGFTFTSTGITVDDDEISTSIDANGIPAPVILTGEDLGSGSNNGLDTTTNWGSSSIAPVIVNRTQPATGAWQVGAYVQ